ncbi:pimeloyl-ACP methyl ester carboxylesterase [Variovorax boronicumulans]|uniref:alpha/beta fold hydrolase n=1 Tax=Variovorax boronicumulans TaxID=436515 RepID=UPI00277D2B98|nr:alpha/beta fold hydrolase [Variovorax boronicumulans]MDQ0038643.1 pimeloyl-ACP methyl ester carboxylesterase [Variovorax boronicumulans]
MNRRTFSIALTSMAATAAFPLASLAKSQPLLRDVVLVHGLYADGSSWRKVIPLLQTEGLNVIAVQNPLTSFDADVSATRRVIDRLDGPVLLVAHSYGGAIISEAGIHPKVKGLVYIAAQAPDAGEDYAALARRFPAAPASAGVVWSTDGFGQLTETAFLRDFAGDLDPLEARAYYAVQGWVAEQTPVTRTTSAAWRSKPSWYGVSMQDRAINADLERFMAKRMNATTVELDASHASPLSRPREVADLILSAAKGVG